MMIETTRKENLDAEIERIKEEGGAFVRTILMDANTTVAIVDASMGSAMMGILHDAQGVEEWCKRVQEEVHALFDKETDGEVFVFVIAH